ncbi:unnamed protein product [Caenorhabditis brenneri]
MGIILSMKGIVWIEGKGYDQYLFNVVNNYYRHPDDHYEDFKVKDIQGGIQLDKDGLVEFFCDNRFNGVAALCEYAQEFYEIPRIQKLECVDVNRGQQESKHAIDWVLNRQETLNVCYLNYQKSANKELKFCLDRIGNQVTDYLVIDAKTTNSFKYTFRHPLTPKYLEFNNPAWLTIHNLYHLNSRVLILGSTLLNLKNANQFLKHWLNGGNSNLLYLSLELRYYIRCPFNVAVILNGIEVIQKNHPEEYTFLYDKEQDLKTSFNRSYEIRKTDGTIVSFVIKNQQNIAFEMCVWPDVNGTPYPVQEFDQQ